MELFLGMIGKAILRGLWGLLKHIASFVTGAVVLAAVTVGILFVTGIRPYVV